MLNAFVVGRNALYFLGALKIPEEGGKSGVLIAVGVVERDVTAGAVIFFEFEFELVPFFMGFLMLPPISSFWLGEKKA
mgnify:CR=1 FL=1